MTRIFKAILLVVFSGLLGMSISAPSFGFDEKNRTVNRSVLGYTILPGWLLTKQEHYEFTPLVSNHDPQNQHPAAFAGQDWDTEKWRSKKTADAALRKFFESNIFVTQYMHGNIPALEIGPTFHKLSELDQRRTLKLLIDESGIFKQGHKIVELVDWSTKEIIGSYTPKGMFLN